MFTRHFVVENFAGGHSAEGRRRAFIEQFSDDDLDRAVLEVMDDYAWQAIDGIVSEVARHLGYSIEEEEALDDE